MGRHVSGHDLPGLPALEERFLNGLKGLDVLNKPGKHHPLAAPHRVKADRSGELHN